MADLPTKFVFLILNVFNSYLKTPGEELHENPLFNNRDVLGVEHVSP